MSAPALSQVAVYLRPEDNTAVAARPLPCVPLSIVSSSASPSKSVPPNSMRAAASTLWKYGATRPRIEIGGQYLVRGKYKLPPGQRRGKLYFFETATGSWNPGAVTTLDLQTTAVDKQEGEFTLVHGMSGPGHFHLVLSDPERYSRMFANVYFGTGDNVLRKKSW